MFTETYNKVYSQVSPGEQAMDEVRRACITQETPKKRRRGISVRAVLIAAVIAALTLTTALAYGDVIKEFIFGNSVARQRTALYYEDRSIYVSRMINAKEPVFEKDEPRIITLYGTGEWAKYLRANTTIPLQPEQPFDASVFPYEIKEPTYLPEGVEGLSETFGMTGEGERSGAKTYSVAQLYKVAIPDEGGRFLADGTLELNQVYFGPNISLEVETTFPIEKVMVGDCEAMLITNDVLFNYSGMTTTTYFLIWIEDDIYYELRNSLFVEIGLDEMIAIAESLA